VPSGGIKTRRAQRAGGITSAPRKHKQCAPLPSGKVRQIVFGLPNEDTSSQFFGLGYREVQEDQPLAPPEAAFDIQMFNHSTPPVVCLPLGEHGKPVKERWELVNVAGEDHNFHSLDAPAQPSDGPLIVTYLRLGITYPSHPHI
jgi:hypothetical protein